ncbi:MAG TPA: PIN domain-containing protein, partial [Gammaproteobacteria bacterium]
MADKRPRLFVLDSSVLMHDPGCLFRFHEHDVFIPMVVLEELDNGKKGLSEVSRNARQTSRFMDELLSQNPDHDMEQGLPLQHLTLGNGDSGHAKGKLFFETAENNIDLPLSFPRSKADNSILATAMAVQKKRPDHEVILVTKDINLRIKARALKIRVEDYYSDQALDDVSLLPTGLTQLPEDFWHTHGKQMESWKEEGRTFYRISGPLPSTWMPGQCLHLNDDSNFQAIVRKLDGNEAIIELAVNYMNPKNPVWGITARNIGQNFALNFLMDPDIDFVTLLGN